MEDHVDCWSRLETAASPDGATFSVSVADDPDELCITHYLQPLNRTVFGPFDKQYNRACSEFLQENKLHKVDKWTFPILFKTAWHASMSA
jgi:hypothetical protein